VPILEFASCFSCSFYFCTPPYLSGGQRQRIVLARLFLRDVDIFIFDEATSALDQYSENIVHDAIQNIAKDKTIIVVAHRESSVRLCDRKIIMETLQNNEILNQMV
jgi:ABC-type bacteriocin/lantibiotic exporter with double-glycine peptidase domain